MKLLLFLLLIQAEELPGRQPQVAIAPDGTIHVAVVHDGNIAVVTPGKEPVVAIDARGKARGGLRRGPRIGCDREGNLVVTAPVCFDAEELKQRYPKNELWLVRSTDKGKTWTKPVRINAVPKKASEALHWMAVAPDGDAHVVWLDHRSGSNQLWYATVSGTKVGKNRQLTGDVCECCAPGLALDAKGNPSVAVRDRAKGDRAVILLTSKNKGTSFSKPKPVNATPTGIST